MLTNTSVRVPLSCYLTSFRNNLASPNHLSGSPVKPCDDEANRCSRLEREAQECFRRIQRDEPALLKKRNFWAVCIVIDFCTIFGTAHLKRMTVYSRIASCILIGALFFFIICIPMFCISEGELNKVRQRANPIYAQAEDLIHSIKERLDEFATIFPENIFQRRQLRDIEVTESLKNNLDEWIDSLRIVHGWDHLAQYWNPPEQAFIASKRNNTRYFVNETFTRYRSTGNLMLVINKIEEFRGFINRTLSPQTEQERDTVAMTRSTNELFRQLTELIYNRMDQERQGIEGNLKSLNRAYKEAEKSRRRR